MRNPDRTKVRRWTRMTPDLARAAMLCLKTGMTVTSVANQFECSKLTIYRIKNAAGGVIPPEAKRSALHLSLAEREEISRGLSANWSFRAIARSLARQPSTISREVNLNGGPKHYRAFGAEARSQARMARPKAAKLALNIELRRQVETWLEVELWSPRQIAARLKIDYPDQPEMWVSHETIYQSLFIQSRGALRKELHECLRTGRPRRQNHKEPTGQGRIVGMINISKRPAEVDDRAVPGHWEGDLIIGKNSKSAIATLVERSTRFVMLAKVQDKRAATVRDAVARQITKLPQELARSLTWDQGTEMSEHAQFTVQTGLPVYFCDPHSPWQRGSNENTNGLLRQFFPKGTDLSVYSQEHLDEVARKLNTRPRQTLGWMAPWQKFAEVVALNP